MARSRRKFYPAARDPKAAWHANWAAHLPSFATKYGLDAAVLAQVQADNDWIQYWTAFRNEADAQMQALVRYYNGIASDDPNASSPSPIVWELPAAAPPAEVRPGIEYRVYRIVDQMEGHMNYAVADGTLLGFATAPGTITPTLPGDPVSPDFTLTTLAEFAVQASFRKLGHDGVKFQYRHKGGNWTPAGTLLVSPGSFTVAPAAADTAEQIEVRGIFLIGNEEVGVYSDARTAFIAP